MRKPLGVMIGLWVLFAVRVAVPAMAAGAREAQIQALAEQLETDVKAWIREEPIKSDSASKLKAFVYDEESISALQAVLAKPRRPFVKLYVTCKLLEPLRSTGTKPARKALPMVKNLRSKFGQYKQLRKYSEGALRRLLIPEYRKGVSVQARLRQVARIQRERDKKRARELPIKQHNEMVYSLDKTYIHLQILADDPKEDEALFQALVQAEKKNLLIFSDIVSIINNETKSMKRQRAGTFYDKILELGKKVRHKRDTYNCPGEVQLKPAENSTFYKQDIRPGIVLLDLANKLAAAAGKKKVKVPGINEVDAYVLLNVARKLAASGDTRTAIKRLDYLLGRYKKTPAAKEARALRDKLTRRSQ